LLYDASGDYSDYRRGVDFYPEGMLLWLDVDATIRQLSKGTKSLDDFCHSFHGGPGGAPALKGYELADVVAALNAVQPNDWATFLNERVKSATAHAPLGGIEHAGWKLAYDGDESDFFSGASDATDLTFSIGLKVKEDGAIADISVGGPAGKAGIAPAMRIAAVNSRAFTTTILREAIGTAVTNTNPIELLIRDGEYYRTYRVDYHGGEKYPHLVRVEGTPDVLSEITNAKTKK
jgi:predicted metalloprotease with PDZ domain